MYFIEVIHFLNKTLHHECIWGSEDLASCICNLGSRWSSFCPDCFFSSRKRPQFPLNKRLYRPQCWSRNWRRPSSCQNSSQDTLILWSMAQSIYGLSNSGSSVFHCVCDRWTKFVSWQYHRAPFLKVYLHACWLPIKIMLLSVSLSIHIPELKNHWA
jgi:hypothetical protein